MIDDQLELRRLHDRQVCGLGALEDARGIDPNLAIRIRQARPVAHQPADFGKRAIQINRRDREARCEVDQLDAPGEERSRASVVKATSISRLVSALSTWTCSPMARAPANASLTVDSEVVALEGLTSTATRVAAGTISRRSSSRFAANSDPKVLIPVTCRRAGRGWRQDQA